jgi:hypothetical protein
MNTKWTVVLAFSTMIGISLAAKVGDTLTVNGKSSTLTVKTIQGSAYVKLSDVARALDMTLRTRGPGRYELVKAGGANQVSGLTGKIGDVLFDGKWRFSVLGYDTPATYAMKTDAEPYDSSGRISMDSRTRIIVPARGYMLVVVTCKVVNGVKERRTLWTAISDNRIRTAIADGDGSSHPPVAYDFKGGPTQTDWILPGAQTTFPVVFSVPDGTKLKDLVFTLKNNQGDEKGVDVRVSLAKS